MLERVIDAGGLDEARAIATAHVDAAIEALTTLPISPARAALEQLARYIVRRTA